MGLDLINPWMLAGLAGISLPIIAHLLSRKKYDVVQWGAMQFLEIGRDAKRRIRLEEFLLLLLRMAMIALLAIALSRPWLSGSLASTFAAKPACDFAVVVDSSYSTAWNAKAKTPREAAVSWAKEFLSIAAAGDTVGLVDARDRASTPVPSLTRDVGLIRESLDTLYSPSGSSRMNDGILRGLQLVNAGTNLSRHVVVVTDGQAYPWRDADEHFWLQLDEIQKQATVPADVWVVNTQKQQARRNNDSIDALELSRELTVLDFPVRIRTRLVNSGGRAAANRRVYLEVDGQRLAEKTISVRVEPNGQASIEFEHRFRTPGSHVVSVSIDDDSLPADNRSEAALAIADALPVLLVDGNPGLAAAETETFFAKSALSASVNPTPWISARSEAWSEFSADSLEGIQVVVLANVPSLTDEQLDALKVFVDGGGGLAIAMGDRVDLAWYNESFFEDGAGVLPARLSDAKTAPVGDDQKPITILSESLQLPWISRFQIGGDDGFLDARFSQWFPATLAVGNGPAENGADDGSVSRNPGMVAARFANGDAFLVSRRFGRGEVILLTSTLDADWTTLPSKPDYVAFLHELVFQLASGRVSRNVETGSPLVFPIDRDDIADNWVFIDPDGQELEAVQAGDELRPMVRLNATHEPGVYRLRRKEPVDDQAARNARDEFFVVNFDRGESDLSPLSEERWAELTEENRLRRLESPDELVESLNSDTARVEIWPVLLLAFLAILIGEVIMTRRLVQGGHAAIEQDL